MLFPGISTGGGGFSGSSSSSAGGNDSLRSAFGDIGSINFGPRPGGLDPSLLLVGLAAFAVVALLIARR